MRIVAAARPVCSATSLIARFLTSLPNATAPRGVRIAVPTSAGDDEDPPRRDPDRPRDDRRPPAAHGDGPRRRRALRPGGRRRHAGGPARRAVEPDEPRAARAHVLALPLA